MLVKKGWSKRILGELKPDILWGIVVLRGMQNFSRVGKCKEGKLFKRGQHDGGRGQNRRKTIKYRDQGGEKKNRISCRLQEKRKEKKKFQSVSRYGSETNMRWGKTRGEGRRKSGEGDQGLQEIFVTGTKIPLWEGRVLLQSKNQTARGLKAELQDLSHSVPVEKPF